MPSASASPPSFVNTAVRTPSRACRKRRRNALPSRRAAAARWAGSCGASASPPAAMQLRASHTAFARAWGGARMRRRTRRCCKRVAGVAAALHLQLLRPDLCVRSRKGGNAGQVVDPHAPKPDELLAAERRCAAAAAADAARRLLRHWPLRHETRTPATATANQRRYGAGGTRDCAGAHGCTGGDETRTTFAGPHSEPPCWAAQRRFTRLPRLRGNPCSTRSPGETGRRARGCRQTAAAAPSQRCRAWTEGAVASSAAARLADLESTCSVRAN